MLNHGMPLSLGSGPFVPGSHRTSLPKFVPRSGDFTFCPNRVQPSVPSIRKVGDTVYVCPIAASCVSVCPSPTPPSHRHEPPALPSPKSPCTSASMTLYFTQICCLRLRFQFTFASRLLRFSRCVPELKKLFRSPARFGSGTSASSFIIGPFSRETGITLMRPPLENTDRPVPSGFPLNGSKIIP